MLRALEGHGLPVPAVLAIGVDERPFLVMERLPGAPPGRLTDDERRTLGRELGALLARLHALDPGELGLATAESPSEATLAQVRQYQRLYESARPAPVPLLGALLAWAERNCPQDDVAPAVLWGDPGAHNLLVADGHVERAPRLGAHARRGPARRPRRRGLELPRIVRPRRRRRRVRGGRGAVDRQRLSYFVALASATRSVMVVNGTRGLDRRRRELARERRPRARAPRPRPGPRRQSRRLGRPARPPTACLPPIRSARIPPRPPRASAAGSSRTWRPRSRIGACAR